MLVYLVRHAGVAVRPERPSTEWHLSAVGREAAQSLSQEPHWAGLRGLHTSPEPKALGTAQRIAAANGQRLLVEPDLREVGRRAWVAEGYSELVRGYLGGTEVGAWEARDSALGRVRRSIDGIAARERGHDVAVVSHGLVLTLYLAALLDLDPSASFELWSRMRFPDLGVIDLPAKSLVREFGEGAPPARGEAGSLRDPKSARTGRRPGSSRT